MSSGNSVLLLGRVVLAVLAAYHLAVGVLSLASAGATQRFVSRFYGITTLDSSPQFRYAVRMLGLQALALGTLAGFAAWNPLAHRDVIVVLAGLQASRAVYRVVFRDSLHAAFGIPVARNAFNASILLAEAAILVALIT